MPAETFDGLFRRQWPSMVRLAALLVGDVALAEDVAQDAFAALYRMWPKMDNELGATFYLRTSVINGARSQLRRSAARHKRDDKLIELPVLTDPIVGAIIEAEEHRRVLAALSELARRQREVLVLRYWAELSEDEIAKTLGISRGTVKSSCSRGLAALTRHLGETS